MESDLTLLTWPDYVNPLTLGQFELEFGVMVKVEIVPSAVELVERMRAPGPPVDVLVPPDYAVRELDGDRRGAQDARALVQRRRRGGAGAGARRPAPAQAAPPRV